MPAVTMPAVTMPAVYHDLDFGFETTVYSPSQLQPDIADEVLAELCPFSSMGKQCKVPTACHTKKLCTLPRCACPKVHGAVTCERAGSGDALCTDEECKEGLHLGFLLRVAAIAQKHHIEIAVAQKAAKKDEQKVKQKKGGKKGKSTKNKK